LRTCSMAAPSRPFTGRVAHDASIACMAGATNTQDGVCIADDNHMSDEVSVANAAVAAGRALEWAVHLDDVWPKALSLIAHELRSPAAVINGYLRLLLQSETDALSERQQRVLNEASSSCARILGLAHELGELASLEERGWTRELSRVAFFSLCDDVIAASNREGGPTAFSCAEADRQSLVNGDAPRLRRAVSALVAAMARERGDSPLEGYGFIENDGSARHVVLALGGPGLASQRQSILDNRTPFDPWRGGGTGLSVPIACRIIEAYDGRLWSGSAGEPIACS